MTSSCYILITDEQDGGQNDGEEFVAVSRTLSSSMRTAMG